MFSEDFVKSLPGDALAASLGICKYFQARDSEFTNSDAKLSVYDDYLTALAFAEVFVGANSLHVGVPKLNYKLAPAKNLAVVIIFFNNWLESVQEELKVREKTGRYETAKQHYAHMFGKAFMYEFSDDDFKRVQKLLNTLRDLLTKSKDFEEEHRLRLLKKLEALQLELHKKMSNFDRFWGFFIDSGIAFRKFWENAEPFRNDVKEVMKIVCRTQAKAENVKNILPLNLLTDGNNKVE